jgi:PAS domain S-box-containing protein
LAEGRIVGLANHTVLISKDGRHIPIDDSAAPIRRPGEPPGGVVLVFRDVSERKEVEHRAKSTADQIRAIVEANPIGVINGDIHGRVNYANDAYLDIIGYTRDDLENGRVDWKAITPPEWLPLDLSAIAEAAQRGVCTPYEKEYVRKDGSRIPVYIGFALVGEQREETIAFILDLTERRRAEEQFTRQLRRLVESNIVGIAVATRRHVIDANDMFLRMVGHTRDDIAARRVEWLQSDTPEATESDRAALRELRERGVCAPYE